MDGLLSVRSAYLHEGDDRAVRTLTGEAIPAVVERIRSLVSRPHA